MFFKKFKLLALLIPCFLGLYSCYLEIPVVELNINLPGIETNAGFSVESNNLIIPLPENTINLRTPIFTNILFFFNISNFIGAIINHNNFDPAGGISGNIDLVRNFITYSPGIDLTIINTNLFNINLTNFTISGFIKLNKRLDFENSINRNRITPNEYEIAVINITNIENVESSFKLIISNN